MRDRGAPLRGASRPEREARALLSAESGDVWEGSIDRARSGAGSGLTQVARTWAGPSDTAPVDGRFVAGRSSVVHDGNGVLIHPSIVLTAAHLFQDFTWLAGKKIKDPEYNSRMGTFAYGVPVDELVHRVG